MAQQIELSTYSKSYKTEANARKAMEKYHEGIRYMVVGNSDNRWQVLVIGTTPEALALVWAGHMVVG